MRQTSHQQNHKRLNHLLCTDDATQIADDLKSIFKHDLADSTIKETLEQQQHFLYKRLPSSTIPMYKQDECVKAENATMTLQN